MPLALDEFFGTLEEEFAVDIPDVERRQLDTPGAVIDYLVESSSVASELDDDDRREHIAGVVGEVIAQTLGITRYRETSRFVEDLHVR
jgi:hypothetical protein